MIEILLAISVVLNVMFVWYIIQLLKRFLNISDEIEGLFVSLEEYEEHVDIVYNLERFFGDTTLENLLRHAKALSETAKNFRATYDINYNEQEEYDEDDI